MLNGEHAPTFMYRARLILTMREVVYKCILLCTHGYVQGQADNDI